MIHLRFTILLLFVTAGFAMAGDDQEKGKVYGNGVTLDDTTLISEIISNPDSWVGKKVLVKGRVVDVCKKRGCWMEIASDQEFQTIRVKVKDGEIVFPLQAKGKLALVEGEVQRIELTKEQTIKQMQHHAEEQGEEFDPASVKEGKTYLQIKGLGAIVYE